MTGSPSSSVSGAPDLINLDIEEDDLDSNPVSSTSTASSFAHPEQSHEWQRLFRDMTDFVKLYQVDACWFNWLLALLPDALHACRPTSCPLDVQQAIIILTYMYEGRTKLAWTGPASELLAQLVEALQSGELPDDLLSRLTAPSCLNTYLDRTWPEWDSFDPCASVLDRYLRQRVVPPPADHPRPFPGWDYDDLGKFTVSDSSGLKEGVLTIPLWQTSAKRS